jgi:hypothetical protein
MALAGNWQIVALLLILERVGRAIKPTVGAMLSYSTWLGSPIVARDREVTNFVAFVEP